MISKSIAVLVASLLATSSVQAACLGVAVNTSQGDANLIWLDVTGSKDSLDLVAAEAAKISARPDKTAPGLRSDQIRVVFDSDVRSDDAMKFTASAQKGDFGQLTVKPTVMSIDTLPADKCPRK